MVVFVFSISAMALYGSESEVMRSLGAATFGNVRFDELVVDAESARRAAAKRGECGKCLAAYAKLWLAFDALHSSSCPSPHCRHPHIQVRTSQGHTCWRHLVEVSSFQLWQLAKPLQVQFIQKVGGIHELWFNAS